LVILERGPIPDHVAVANGERTGRPRRQWVARRSPALDRVDIAILSALQRNVRSTVQSLADRVGLSPRACLERIRRLETAKIITGYQAIIDIAALSRPINVFAEINPGAAGRLRAASRQNLQRCRMLGGRRYGRSAPTSRSTGNQATSWRRPRKVVARLECSLQPVAGETGMRQEVDVRYVVTSLEDSAQHLYENVYCQRGTDWLRSEGGLMSSPKVEDRLGMALAEEGAPTSSAGRAAPVPADLPAIHQCIRTSGACARPFSG
jgi:DNA-binding Lrp family transcriptional regulator